MVRRACSGLLRAASPYWAWSSVRAARASQIWLSMSRRAGFGTSRRGSAGPTAYSTGGGGGGFPRGELLKKFPRPRGMKRGGGALGGGGVAARGDDRGLVLAIVG